MMTLRFLRNVDSSEKQQESNSSSIFSTVPEFGRRSAAKTTAPYHSGQSGRVEASPEVCLQQCCFYLRKSRGEVEPPILSASLIEYAKWNEVG